MPTNFPTSLDTTTNLSTTNVDATTNATIHPGLHNTEDGALIAVETKLGIGASTPTNGRVLTGGATPGTSAWQVTSAIGTATNMLASGAVKGDNATEDDVAINAIIATAGDYYFPGNRTYLLGGAIWVKVSNVTLEFGPGAILKMKAAGNQPMLVIGNETSTTITDISIIGGEFDGNASTQTWRIPHAGVGLGALTSHAAYYSGVIGIGVYDVYRLTFLGTRVRNCLNNLYQINKVGDVQFLGCRGDGAGMSRSLKDPTGAGDPEPNNTFNIYSAPPTTVGTGTGIRLVGCMATNTMDVGFECHGNGLSEYTITGCNASGSAPAGTGNNIGAHTGYEFEMESADTSEGGFGTISGNTADNLNIAYSCLNTANQSYDMKTMVFGANHASSCTTGLDMNGRHISVTGFTAENITQCGVSTNSIAAWITKTSNGVGNTATVINFPASSFSAAQQTMLVGYYATITSGTQSGLAAFRQITACTATQITVSPGYAGVPDATSVFKFANHGDWTFTGCVIHISGHANQFAGMLFKVNAGVVLDGVSIDGCVFQGCGSTGTDSLYSGVYTTGNVLNLEVNGGSAHGFKHGIDINSPYPVKINGGVWHNNNDTGIVVCNNTFTNTGSIIQNTRCVDNGVNPTSGVDSGIYLDLSVDALLEGNVCENTYSGGYQSNGIKLSASTTGATIKNGDLRGNASTALAGTLSTTTLKEVSGVLGVNDTLAAGATGAAGTSAYLVPKSYRPSNLGVFGGIVSLITVGGVTVATATNVVVPVPANVQAIITWSSVPTLSQVLL